MSDVDLDAEQYEKHREAGEILAKVRNEAAKRVEVGASHLEIAEWAEERIRELGGQPAFPVNISIDEEAAHATPSVDDTTTFGEDMVNLDIGVHVDGWLADTAVTVDLSGNPELAEASEEALDAALDAVEPGVATATTRLSTSLATDSATGNSTPRRTSPTAPSSRVPNSKLAMSSPSNRSLPTAAAKSARGATRRYSRWRARGRSVTARPGKHSNR